MFRLADMTSPSEYYYSLLRILSLPITCFVINTNKLNCCDGLVLCRCSVVWCCANEKTINLNGIWLREMSKLRKNKKPSSCSLWVEPPSSTFAVWLLVRLDVVAIVRIKWHRHFVDHFSIFSTVHEREICDFNIQCVGLCKFRVQKSHEMGQLGHCILTHGLLEPFRLTLPRDKHSIDGNAGENHETTVACLNWTGDHRYNGHKNGGQQVHNWEHQRHTNWTR